MIISCIDIYLKYDIIGLNSSLIHLHLKKTIVEKSKEFKAGEKFAATFFSVLGGLLSTLFFGLIQSAVLLQRAFDRYWMREKGSAPEGYMYVIFWVIILVAPYLLVQAMKLLLPDSLLEFIDTILGIVVTIALIAATVVGVSSLRKK